uniref:Putative cytochrome n=1 Tax=Corethrella appendiculata TaxID=1370023 RepID=U5EVJ2_9DIPT
MNEIGSLLFGILIIVISTKLVQWYLKRKTYCDILNRIPGPKQYPVIGTMYEFFGASKYDFFYINTKHSKVHREIYRVWVGMECTVRIIKPEYIEQLIDSTKHIQKSSIYRFLLPWLGRGLLTSFGERWFQHRKILTPTFHFSILDTFCSVFSENSSILVDCLRKYSNTGQSFDVFPYVARSTLDIICETAMGVKVNAQNENVENEYVKAVHEASILSLVRAVKPWLYPNLLFTLSSTGAKQKQVLSILHSFTEGVIKERKLALKNNTTSAPGTDNESDGNIYGRKRRLAFLDLLLQANEKDNLLTDKDIREEVDTFMFEGHDTTASSIAWTLFFVALYPDIQDKIVEELKTIFQQSDREATMQDLNEMKYLERVIKESLRLNPSVNFFSRIISEDIYFGEYFVPKGTNCTVDVYHLHRNEKYFPDPEKFDPDRFLIDNISDKHPFSYIPFSAGPRNCIGQKFAMLELKSEISTILRSYKIKPTQRREDVHICSELVGRPYEGIHLIIEDRAF